MKIAGYDKARCFSFSPLRFLLAAAVLLFPSVAWATNVTVDCSGATPGVFTTIGAALATLDNIGPHTITVTGTCVENVNIQSRERLTLQGPGPVAGMATIVNAANPPFWALNVGRSRQVTLRGLIVKGGSTGIRTDSASSVDIQDCIVEDNPGNGIDISEQSTIRINRTIIRNNGMVGLNVTANSTVSLSLGGPVPQFIHIHNNGAAGISANGSFVSINGGTTIEDNNGNGLSVTGGRLNLNANNDDNIVRNNTGSGVSLTGSASAAFSGQNIIQNNLGIGVLIIASSAQFNQRVLTDGTVRATLIEGSLNSGITVAHSGHATLQGHHKIRNHGGTTDCPSTVCGGVRVFNSSTFEISNGVEITNNTGPGIFTDMHADIVVTAPVTVTGNTGGDIQLTLASGMIVLDYPGSTGNVIGSVTCDNTGFLSGPLGGIRLIDCKNVIVQKRKKNK